MCIIERYIFIGGMQEDPSSEMPWCLSGPAREMQGLLGLAVCLKLTVCLKSRNFTSARNAQLESVAAVSTQIT